MNSIFLIIDIKSIIYCVRSRNLHFVTQILPYTFKAHLAHLLTLKNHMFKKIIIHYLHIKSTLSLIEFLFK